jgi:hypothetical protein
MNQTWIGKGHTVDIDEVPLVIGAAAEPVKVLRVNHRGGGGAEGGCMVPLALGGFLELMLTISGLTKVRG